MERENIYSGTVWEKTVAYSRLVKVGNQIFVSGTTAVDETGHVVGKNDVYRQSMYIFKKIETALASVGASLDDVVRTRTFVTDIGRFNDFAKAHAETFSEIDPAATCVEVSGLINDQLLIEIEVDAVQAIEQKKSL